jgi:4-amino-4-deoxy-L-arabinose transferase-like glycosyltransferase
MVQPAVVAILCAMVLISCMRLLWPTRGGRQFATAAAVGMAPATFSPFLTRLRETHLPALLRRPQPDRAPPPPAPTPERPPSDPPEGDPGFRLTFAVSLASAVAFVILGQFIYSLDEQNHLRGVVLIALGLALFVLARLTYAKREDPRWLRGFAGRLGLQPFQLILILPGLGAATATRWLAGEEPMMSHPWLALLAYLGGLAVLVVGWRRRQSPQEAQEASPLGPPWTRPEIWLFVALAAFAFFIRAFGNGSIPAALNGDEGGSGLAAVEFARGRFNNPFIMGWYSFPSMYFTLPALSIAIGGQNYAALRMPSAIAGALAVMGLYWMARPMFGRGTAFFSAALLSTLNLHLHFSRIGLNNIWDAFFAVLAVGVFWRGWRTGRRGYFILAGLLVGLSQYFYASSRLVPLILLAWLIVRIATDWKHARRRLPDVLAMWCIAIAVVLPLAMYYVAHPDTFMAPLERFSILSNNWLTTVAAEQSRPVWLILLLNFRDAALGFTAKPLVAWFQSGNPLLQPIPAGLFLMGVLLAFLNIRDATSWLLLLWLAGVTAIGGLTVDPPGSQRYVIGAPVAALMAGIAVQTIAHWVSEVFPRRRTWTYGLATVLVIVAMGADLQFYFGEYVPNEGFGDPNTQVASQLGHFLEGFPSGSEAYFFGAPRMGYYGFPTIPFMAPQVTGIEVEEPLESPPDWRLTGPTAFVFLPERESEMALVRERYPDGGLVRFLDRDGSLLFIVYEVGVS